MNIMFEKEIHILKSRDPILSKIIDRVGDCTLQLNSDAFHILVESIIHQLISMKAARTILKRFRLLFPEDKFPTPLQVLEIHKDKLKSIGISNQKFEYLRNLSSKFIDGTITPVEFPKMTDTEIINHLIQVKGIGRWTAEMFLIFSLGRPNVFPIDDLAIQKALVEVYKFEATKENYENIRKLWSPYCTTAVWYLWEKI